MRSNFWLRAAASAVAALSLAISAWAYIPFTDASEVYVVKWQTSPITMSIHLATPASLIDGTSQTSSVKAAMQAWNAQLGTVQIVASATVAGTPASGNQVNEIWMDSTMDGDAFPAGVLAITLSYSSGNALAETDIVFNSAYTWNSYRGVLRSGIEDIRRVAIHEMGHALGLDHPDDHSQYVTAIMNSHESDIDALQSDDVAGGQKLYGAPGFLPSNDAFANAGAIVLNGATAAVNGANIAATREAGEPSHADSTGNRSVWWKWTAPSSGSATCDTLGSNFDTVLAIYTGSSVAALTAVGANDDSEPASANSNPLRKRTSTVNFEAVGGTTYFIAVDGWDSASSNTGGYTGSIVLTLTFTRPFAPTITSHPSSQSVEAGQIAIFSVTANGNPAPSYQWQRLATGGTWTDLNDGNGYSGAGSSTLAVVTTLVMDGEQYRCTARNTAGVATSGSAVLNVRAPVIPPAITDQPNSQTVYAGSSAVFTVSVAGTSPLTFQWKKGGEPISETSNVTGTKTGTLTFRSVALTDFGSYTVTISNGGGTVTSSPVMLIVKAIPPLIVIRPRGQVVATGATITLSSAVSSSGQVYYHWMKDGGWVDDGGRISGANTATLTISPAEGSDAGNYVVVVSTQFPVFPNDQAVLSPPAPVIVSGSSGVVAVAAGAAHCLFVKQDGTLWAMGRNSSGQLGDGSTVDRLKPVLVASGVTAVGAGANHSLFIKNDGTLWTMGTNQYGQLGDGTTSDRSTPVQVASNVVAAFGGDYHSLFLKSDNTLWGCGGNYGGQLGDGTTQNRLTAVQVASDILTAACGDEHTLYVKRDGSLWATGQDYDGQLGDGSSSTRLVAVQVATGVRAVAGGWAHSLFLKNDDSLWGMGRSGSGELGVGGTLNQLTPVISNYNVKLLGCRTTGAVAVQTEGAIWRFGWGTRAISGAPFRVAALAVGESSVYYLDGKGTLFAGGGNSYGQLGDGTTTDSSGFALTGGQATSARPKILVSVRDEMRAPGQANPAFIATYSGFLNGDSENVLDVRPTMSTPADQSSPAGAYPITLAGGKDDVYDFVFDNGVLTLGALPTAPQITSSASTTFTSGVAGSFSIKATGSPSPIFSASGLPPWASLDGVTGALVGTPPDSDGSPFSISITASNGVSPAATQTVILTVQGKPTPEVVPGFASQPVGVSIRPGGSAAFSIIVSGTPAPALQWQVSTDNGASWTNLPEEGIYSGASSTTLSISGVTLGMDGYRYRCAANNRAGSVTSAPATLVVSSQDFAGAYFGSLDGTHGLWALRVDTDRRATFLAYLAQRGTAIEVHLTVNADGSFSANGTEIAASGVSVAHAMMAGGDARKIRGAVASAFNLNGQISSGSIAGQISGIGESFTGDMDSSGGHAPAGSYSAAALNSDSGASYAIVAGSGQALVVTVGAGRVDAVLGTLNSDGRMSANTLTGAQLTLAIDASKQLLNVSVAAAGSATPVVFSGLADGTTSTTRAVNISARAYCGTSNKVTIGGFVVSGSVTKRVLVRAVGPSLTAQGIGVSEALADPSVEVHDAVHGNSIIATNDNWGDNANAAAITSTAATVGATALLNSDSKSSGLLLDLSPGVYSFVVRGAATSSGVVLLEVYDADAAATGTNFSNISTRAYATTGNGVTIGGFVVSGNAPKRVLLRAVGPTLTTQGLGGAEVLVDPQIELHDASHGNAIIATNDDWGTNANAASITTAGARIGATPLDASDTKSAALLLTLQPGVYSFVASGKTNAPSGVVLVEVYDAD